MVYLSGRFVIETSLFKLLVEEYLSRRSGMLVTMGEVSPAEGAGWGAQIKRLAVMDGARSMLSADGALATIDFSAALDGDLRFASVHLSKARLNLIRGKDGRLNIGSWESQSLPFETLPKKLKRILRGLDYLAVEECSVSWTDMMAGKKAPLTAEFSGIGLKLWPEGMAADGRAITLQADALTPKGTGTLKIKGRLTNTTKGPDGVGFEGSVTAQRLDAGHFWPYLGKILPFQRLNLTASLDSQITMGSGKGFSSKGTVTVSGLDLIYRQAYRERLKAERISLAHDVSVMGDSIAVREAQLEAGGVSMRLSGEGHKLTGENPLIYVEMDLDRIQIGELKKFVPYNYLTPVQSGFVEKNIGAGEIRISGLTFDGDLKTLESLDKFESYKSISGMLEIFGLRLSAPGLERDFTDIGGEFVLAGDELYFTDLTGKYGKSSLSAVTGMVGRLHQWPIFEARIKAGLDLEEARRGLAARVVSPELRTALDQVEYITGQVGVDLTVKGDSEDISRTISSEGKITLAGVGMKSPSFSEPLSGVNGEVNLAGGKAVFPGLSWWIGPSRFFMTGSLSDVLGPAPVFDLKIASKLDLGQVARLWPDKPKVLDHLDGTAHAATFLKGGFGAYSHHTEADLREADVILAETVFKRPGMPASLSLRGRGKFGGTAQINKLAVGLGASKAEVEGDIAGFMADTKGAQVNIRAEKVFFDDLDYYTDIFDNIDSRGSISGDITAVNGGPGAPVELFGAARVAGCRFKLRIFQAAFEECSGDFELTGHNVFMRKAAGKFGQGRFAMSGSADGSAGKFKLSAVTSALDLDDLFGDPKIDLAPRPGKEGVEGLWKDPVAGEKEPKGFFDGEWDILISSQAGLIGPLTYRSLDTRIHYKDDLFTVKPFSFHGHGGEWKWSAQIRDMRRAIDLKSEIDVRDVAMESLGDQAGEKLIHGRMNISGQVNGHGRTWKQISSTLDGRLELAAGAGEINRLNLLGKIFSLLNLSQYFKLKLPDLRAEGLPFNGITAFFGLAGGKAHTSDLTVDSEAIRLTAVGEYDIAAGRVNVVVGALPFITIDRAISAVPLLGEALTGEDKSLIGYYFKAEGPLDNPEITSVSLEALTEGLRGMLKRIMELPAKAGQALGAANGGK